MKWAIFAHDTKKVEMKFRHEEDVVKRIQSGKCIQILRLILLQVFGKVEEEQKKVEEELGDLNI